MHPTLDLDFAQIDLYTALVAAGIFVGLVTAYVYLRLRSRRAGHAGAFLDAALVTLAAGWIGARAYHIATHWDYYRSRPEEIGQWGASGLGIRGALILGFIALAAFAYWRRVSLARLLDAAALGLAIGQCIGWVGALVQGANYGVVSDSQVAMELADLYGLVQPRLPVQHAEIILYATVFLVLILFALRRPRSGLIFFVYLVIVSLANGFLGAARADDTARWGTLRIDQLVDGAMVLVGAIGLLWLSLETRRRVPMAAGGTSK